MREAVGVSSAQGFASTSSVRAVLTKQISLTCMSLSPRRRNPCAFACMLRVSPHAAQMPMTMPQRLGFSKGPHRTCDAAAAAGAARRVLGERPGAQHASHRLRGPRSTSTVRVMKYTVMVAAAGPRVYAVRCAAQSHRRTLAYTRRPLIGAPVRPTARAAAIRALGMRRRAGAGVSGRAAAKEDVETEAEKDNSETDADAPQQTRERKEGERVVGVAGGAVIPQRIIDAERAANPLRRPRLLVYCLAACVAAAQVRLGRCWGFQTARLPDRCALRRPGLNRRRPRT